MATRAAATQGELLADGAYREAMQRAGHLLAARPRSEHEIRIRLTDSGFDDAVVERTVTRLVALRLLDDRSFARQWVEERARLKGRSPEALIVELQGKGITRELAEEALEAAGIDEEAQARQVAARLVGKVAHKALAEQGAALMTMLIRRGFSPEAAEVGARSALPPEGWD